MLFKGKGSENIVCSRNLEFTELIQPLWVFRSWVHSKIHDSSLIHFYGRWSGIYKLFKKFSFKTVAFYYLKSLLFEYCILAMSSDDFLFRS